MAQNPYYLAQNKAQRLTRAIRLVGAQVLERFPLNVILTRTVLISSLGIHFTVGPLCLASPVELPPNSFRAGSWGVSTQTEYFNSDANFTENRAQFERLNQDSSFSNLTTSLKGRYHPSKSWGFFGGLTLSQTRTVDPVNEKTNTGIGEFFAGLYSPFSIGRTRIIGELEFSLPASFGGLASFETPIQRTPLLNDSSPFARGLIHAQRRFGSWRLLGYLGARIPTDGLATTALYMASVERTFIRSWSLALGLHGFETVLSDQKTRIDRTSTANTAGAGSFRFRSYNPALTSAFAATTLNLNTNWSVRLGYDSPLIGLNTAYGHLFLLQIQYQFAPALKKRKRIRPEDRVTAPGNSPNFKIEAESLDPAVIAPESDFEPSGRDDLNETERLLKEGN